MFKSVLRIRDILVQIQIRIRGFVPVTNGSELGSGSVSQRYGSCYFRK
jgi:hypothetical protein